MYTVCYMGTYIMCTIVLGTYVYCMLGTYVSVCLCTYIKFATSCSTMHLLCIYVYPNGAYTYVCTANIMCTEYIYVHLCVHRCCKCSFAFLI